MKCDASGQHCLKRDDCCDTIITVNQYCYKAHCTATAKCLAEALNLSPDQWTIAFQSRLTRDPWILPDTPSVLEKLAKNGTKRVAVVCPAFVADCLETLEEIGLEAAEQFLEDGGEDFVLVPCLNDSQRWVETVCELIRDVQGAQPAELIQVANRVSV